MGLKEEEDPLEKLEPLLTLGNRTHHGGDDNSMKRGGGRVWNFCTKDQKRGGGGTETFSPFLARSHDPHNFSGVRDPTPSADAAVV